jgi:hypothetical protein
LQAGDRWQHQRNFEVDTADQETSRYAHPPERTQELDQGPSRKEKLRLENNAKNSATNFKSSHTKNRMTHWRCKEMIFSIEVQTKLQSKHGGHRPPYLN